MRRLRHVLTIALLATAMAVVGASPASAVSSGCDGLTADGTSCNLEDILPPAPGSGPLYVNDNRGGPFYSWFATGISCNLANAPREWSSLNNVAAAFSDLALILEASLSGAIQDLEASGIGGDELADQIALIEGRVWFAELMQPDGTPTNTGLFGCAGPTEQLPEPPRPPSPDEVWGAALTFEPAVHLDPYVRGLVGLETFLWYEGETTGSINPPLALRGYDLAAEIQAFQFEWDLGAPDRDGERIVVASTPGSADDPAGSHIFAEPAEAVVSHAVYWTGTYTITGPGFPPGGLTYDLGVAAIVVSRDYQVIEIRTPVVPGG
jgi:hypothetical protein